VTLTAEPWRFPQDLPGLRNALESVRTDLLILDSLQQHIPAYQRHETSAEAMRGLIRLAEEFELAVVLIGHTVKTSRGSVESMIGGAGVIQNLAKAIYVLGPDPVEVERDALPRGLRNVAAMSCAICGESTERDSVFCAAHETQRTRQGARRVLACERLGVGPLPPSLLFELDTTFFDPTGREEPFLRLIGESEHGARSVLDAIHRSSQVAGPRDESKRTEIALWLIRTLEAHGPMPTHRVISAARREGMYSSENTFDRVRKAANVDAIAPGQLRSALGDHRYEELSEEDRKRHWMRLGPAQEPPVEEWRTGPAD
ncbi:MAG: hypothetical protein M3O88_09780, partial [Actinomycetota bacterium]|nr:hypothetical protein [Actinomycetota bacterium]